MHLVGGHSTLRRDETNQRETYEGEKKRRNELDKNEKNEGEEERGSQGERKGEKKMRQ